MDCDERDERNDFDQLDGSEQNAIRLLLDCAGPSPNRNSRYVDEWVAGNRGDLTMAWAAEGVLAIVPRLAEQLAHKENWTDCGLNGDRFYGVAVRIATFCLMNSLIRTYHAFDFLFVRLFGGAARPLNPSLFVAGLLHPCIAMDAFDLDEIEKAKRARAAEWGTHDPVWFPNRVDRDCA